MLAERVDARIAEKQSLGLDDVAGKVDFTLAFAMVHEMPDSSGFFQQAAKASKPGALLCWRPPATFQQKDLKENFRKLRKLGSNS